jgi:hypothetical protein
MLTKPLVINRLSTGWLADWSESGGIVNNLTFALWITGIRLGEIDFWGEKKNEYAGWCFFGVLAFVWGLPLNTLLKPPCLILSYWVLPPYGAYLAL